MTPRGNAGPPDADGDESPSQPDTEGETGSADYSVPIVVGSLVAGVFFGGVGGGVAFPTLPTLGTLLGISPFVVGLILSINRFTRLLMNTPAGQIIDRVGPRKPMIVGFFLQGIPPFGYAAGLHPDRIPYLDATEIFLASRSLWGVGSAMVFVGAFSTIVHITSRDNRGRWLGYFRGGQSLGIPAGLVTGGLLTDLYSYEVAFVVAGIAGFLAALVAALVLPDIDPSVGRPTSLRDVPRIVRSDSRIPAICSVNFTIRFLFIGVLSSTVVVYAQRHGIEVRSFSAVGASGVLLAIAFVFSSATTLVSGNFSDKIDSRALVTLPALGLFGLGFVLLGVRPTLPATTVGIACIGIGVGGTNPPLMAYLGDISHAADTGKIGGVYNVFGDLGGTLGPMVALPLAARIGHRAEYLLCAGLVALTSVLVIRALVSSAPDAPRAEASAETD